MVPRSAHPAGPNLSSTSDRPARPWRTTTPRTVHHFAAARHRLRGPRHRDLPPSLVPPRASVAAWCAYPRTCTVQTEASGLLGSTQETGYIRATAWVGTDLSQTTVIGVDHSTKQVHIELVLPRVMQVTLDHQASKVECEREGLWPVALGSAHEAELTQQLFDQTHRQLVASSLDPLLQRRAKLQAQVVLQQFFERQGWRVQVTRLQP